MKKTSLLVGFILAVMVSTAYAGTVSFDQLTTGASLTAAKYNDDLNTIYTEFNGSVEGGTGGNIAADTIAEVNMADDANPRIRCDEYNFDGYVASGLLATTSGTLSTDTPAGVAYPDGYRISKGSATSHSYTANKWTWVYLDINGNFQYSETAWGAAQPATPANSCILFRVSTDTTTVNTVTDLRKTDLSTLILDRIVHGSTEPTLHNILKNGIPQSSSNSNKGGTAGWVQGLGLEFIDYSTFKVKSGSIWVGDEYRIVSADLTIPSTQDDPAAGTSGIVSGTLAADTLYNVYAVADNAGVKTLSVSYGTAPSGLTNYRKIGEIKTDSASHFTSQDLLNAYSYSPRETIGAWVHFDGTGTIAIKDSQNVSSIVDNGIGQYTITWDKDFANANYVCVGQTSNITSPAPRIYIHSYATGSVQVLVHDTSGVITDDADISIIAIGQQ